MGLILGVLIALAWLIALGFFVGYGWKIAQGHGGR
jgi:hypothetical protein